MHKLSLCLSGLLLAACSSEFGTASTHQCKGGVISVDSTAVAEVVKKCGPPNHIAPIENRYGATLGERWEYVMDGRTLMLVIRDGRVRRIDITS